MSNTIYIYIYIERYVSKIYPEDGYTAETSWYICLFTSSFFPLPRSINIERDIIYIYIFHVQSIMNPD